MFTSEELYATSSGLSKAWQSAMQGDHKVTKVQILQHNVPETVSALIHRDDGPPLALRAQAQLLFGITRIYSRKARYLLDDSRDSWTKISMAFKPTQNHDAPEAQLRNSKDSLTLRDRITPFDINKQLPDFDLSFPLSQDEEFTATPLSGRKIRDNARDIDLPEDYAISQIFIRGDSYPREEEVQAAAMEEELDLELDFGLDAGPSKMDTTMEMGRGAPAEILVDEDMFGESDKAGPSKEHRTREPSSHPLELDSGLDVQIVDGEGDIVIRDDLEFHVGDQSAVPLAEEMPHGRDMNRSRISESPLSDIDPDFARRVEEDYERTMDTVMVGSQEELEPPIAVVARQRAKRSSGLQPDEHTFMGAAYITGRLKKHDDLLKPRSFLSQDSLSGLREEQKSGGFVVNVLLDGRGAGWAPELQGLLTFSVLRPDLKRKRYDGLVDVASEEGQETSKSPRLEIPADESISAPAETVSFAARCSLAPNTTVLEIATDDSLVIGSNSSLSPGLDETTIPAVHPAASAPVSIGTKKAVHLLRDLFGQDAAADEAKRKTTSVVFQELLPETTTSKADATRMFFECLVLATKDAIKVEQPRGSLGGPIRVRGKRGLWGAWAEHDASLDVDSQQAHAHSQQQEENMNMPQPAIATAATVSVEA